MAMQGGYPSAGARYYCLDSDFLAVNPNRSDADIQREIELTLVFDTWVNSDQVKVEVKDGVATLTGNVDALIAKRSAGDDAWDTIGVLDVVNNIKVKEPKKQPARAARQRQRKAEAEPAR